MNSIIHLTFNNLKLIIINEFMYVKRRQWLAGLADWTCRVEWIEVMMMMLTSAGGSAQLCRMSREEEKYEEVNVIIIIIISDDETTCGQCMR